MSWDKINPDFGSGLRYGRNDPPSDGMWSGAAWKRKGMALGGTCYGGALEFLVNFGEELVEWPGWGIQWGPKTLSVLQRGWQTRGKGQHWGQGHDVSASIRVTSSASVWGIKGAKDKINARGSVSWAHSCWCRELPWPVGRNSQIPVVQAEMC